jgi:DNA-binding response OmpR family regulator
MSGRGSAEETTMKRTKKILSIDDEPAILKCLEHALSSQGYNLQGTSDPDEGIRMIKEDPDICLALLDIRMPKKNGFDIYREVRQFRKIPVLFVTAYPGSFTTKSDDVVEMWRNEFADGTTDIVYKPFDLTTLFEKVEGLIGSASEDDEEK